MNTADIAKNLIEALQGRLGALWDAIPPGTVKLLQDAALDWAELQVEALATPRTPDAQQRLARRKADVHAQLMNLQSVAASQGPAIAEAFWAEAQAVLGAAVGLAFLAV